MSLNEYMKYKRSLRENLDKVDEGYSYISDIDHYTKFIDESKIYKKLYHLNYRI